MTESKKYYTIESLACEVEFIGEFETFAEAFDEAQSQTQIIARMVIGEEKLKNIVRTAINFVIPPQDKS